ncbi:hypothetical protein BDF19DRAFT_178457 [Syncephalis fuscata]|nr:hypothetical protein BDF19DRAFT_178457 [Syncephalis fuscata]
MKTKLNQLMRATLNKEEEKQLAEYCEDFEAPYRLDFLIMYHVHHINYVEAIQLNERARQREDPRRAVSRQVMRRNAIIENLRSLLPRVQRNAMEVGMSLNQTLGQSSQNQHFPLVTPLLSSVSNARHLPPTALSSLMQSPHGSYGPVVASGLPPLSTSKDINQIEGQSAEESEISLLRVIALHQARQQSPHLALSQLLEQEQQQQQSTTSVNKFSSSNTASAETANVSAHKRNQSNTSNSAAKRVQSPEWAKRMDASLSPVMIGHENEDSYSNDTASNYQRRKSTPLPPLRRNSPFPPRTPQSPHQDSSNGSRKYIVIAVIYQ